MKYAFFRCGCAVCHDPSSGLHHWPQCSGSPNGSGVFHFNVINTDALHCVALIDQCVSSAEVMVDVGFFDNSVWDIRDAGSASPEHRGMSGESISAVVF
jgi:hypothetical protein